MGSCLECSSLSLSSRRQSPASLWHPVSEQLPTRLQSAFGDVLEQSHLHQQLPIKHVMPQNPSLSIILKADIYTNQDREFQSLQGE